MGVLSVLGGAAASSNPLITNAGIHTATGKALGLFPEDGTSTPTGFAGDTVTLGSGGLSASATEALFYHAQVQKLSLLALFQQAASPAETSSESQTSGAQMAFSFYSETREQELGYFRSTTATNADGLSTTQQTTYLEVSRKVAGRFKVSFDLSGSALQDFANAVRGLGSKDEITVDKILSLMRDALGQGDDTTNQVFQLLSGFMSGLAGTDDQLSKFIDSIYNSGLMGGAASGNAAAQGQSVQTQGMQLHFEFDVQFQSEETIQYQDVQVQQSDPITLDLDGDGIELSSYRNGADFDITGSGKRAKTAFVNGGDAFLALDRNKNGVIDSGKELFGDQNGARNGYEELAKLDTNGDGLINAKDRDFDSLMLFRDNGNGRTERGELVSLAKAGITELDLHYASANQKAAGGNSIAQTATYRRSNGQLGQTADAILNYIA